MTEILAISRIDGRHFAKWRISSIGGDIYISMSLKFDVTSPPKLLNPQQKNDTTGKSKSRSCDAYYFDNENSKGGPTN